MLLPNKYWINSFPPEFLLKQAWCEVGVEVCPHLLLKQDVVRPTAMNPSETPAKRRNVSKASESLHQARRAPQHSQNDGLAYVYIKRKANQPSLPAEIPLPILHHALNPCLMHVCRSLWLKLPAYTSFCKGLKAMVLYLRPEIVDSELRNLMDSFWKLYEIPSPSGRQLDELR